MKNRNKDAAAKENQQNARHSEHRREGMARKWLLPVLCIILILGLGAGLYHADELRSKFWPVPQEYAPVPKETVFPTFQEEILLCSDTAKKLYDGQIDIETAVQTAEPYRAFVFEYDVGSRPGTLLISEDSSFTKPQEYTLEAFHTTFRIENLKTGTTYYYKAIIDEEVFTGTFRTAESTRFISIPGTVNTRDIGGYTNLDGKKVRQGLLIRGTDIDGLENPNFLIPEESLESVRQTFGFVYDFDLRSGKTYEGTYQSPLGADVGHVFYASPQYEQLFEPAWYPNLRNIFADLADPAKYPMYLHCTWGRDSTGTIVFLLQGVLNMSQEDMMQEYLLSGFVFSETMEDGRIAAVAEEMAKYEGNTLQEKIVNYLITEVGVTEAKIQSIREIFLEP